MNEEVKEVPAIHGPLEQISYSEVEMALCMAKNRKAAGPSEITSEMFTSAGYVGLDMLVSVYRCIMRNVSAPEGWHESITLPLFKGKGYAPSCEKYRGLRLLEHVIMV